MMRLFWGNRSLKRGNRGFSKTIRRAVTGPDKVTWGGEGEGGDEEAKRGTSLIASMNTVRAESHRSNERGGKLKETGGDAVNEFAEHKI